MVYWIIIIHSNQQLIREIAIKYTIIDETFKKCLHVVKTELELPHIKYTFISHIFLWGKCFLRQKNGWTGFVYSYMHSSKATKNCTNNVKLKQRPVKIRNRKKKKCLLEKPFWVILSLPASMNHYCMQWLLHFPAQTWSSITSLSQNVTNA